MPACLLVFFTLKQLRVHSMKWYWPHSRCIHTHTHRPIWTRKFLIKIKNPRWLCTFVKLTVNMWNEWRETSVLVSRYFTVWMQNTPKSRKHPTHIWTQAFQRRDIQKDIHTHTYIHIYVYENIHTYIYENIHKIHKNTYTHSFWKYLEWILLVATKYVWHPTNVSFHSCCYC